MGLPKNLLATVLFYGSADRNQLVYVYFLYFFFYGDGTVQGGHG